MLGRIIIKLTQLAIYRSFLVEKGSLISQKQLLYVIYISYNIYIILIITKIIIIIFCVLLPGPYQTMLIQTLINK